jgi:N12 class adenine-specific DNA methylase
VQNTNNVKELLARAAADEPWFSATLKNIAARIPGTEVFGPRIKTADSVEEKLSTGKTADTIDDYLAGTITVTSFGQAAKALRLAQHNLTATSQVAARLLESPKYGYRSIYLQVKTPSGLVAELQIMPKPILDYSLAQGHAYYEKWRRRIALSDEERQEKDLDYAEMARGYQAAWAKFIEGAPAAPDELLPVSLQGKEESAIFGNGGEEDANAVGSTGETTPQGTPPEPVQSATPSGHPRSALRGGKKPSGGPNVRGNTPGSALAGGETPSDAGEHLPSERGGTAEPRRESTSPAALDYQLSPQVIDHIEHASPKAKAEANIAAIKRSREIASSGRAPYPEEEDLLAKFVGWGGLPQIFADRWNVSREWIGLHDELSELLDYEEWAAARASTLNAHFTSPLVIPPIWEAVRRLGFRGGRVLEPAIGSGNFYTMMPGDLAERSMRTGIELDPTTGMIASQLLAHSDIRVQGFEKALLPDGFYRLVISNFPFGNYKLYDPRYNKLKLSIHNYFFAKSLDKLEPGGLIAAITTHYTLDEKDPAFRQWLADRADLVGAMRLPNTAFKGNAGTEVVTDILFLRKRFEGEAPGDRGWIDSKDMKLKSESGEKISIPVNQYFHQHPEMVLGTHSLSGGMYAENEYTVLPKKNGPELPQQISEAALKLPEGVLTTVLPNTGTTEEATRAILRSDEAALKPGAYAIATDGTIGRVVGIRQEKQADLTMKNVPEIEPVALSAKDTERIKSMITLRKSLQDCLNQQVNNEPEETLQAGRTALREAYDAFVKKYGPVNDPANQRAFGDDPDAPLLTSLENWDKDAKQVTSVAPIFTRRTINIPKSPTTAGSPEEAYTISMNMKGRPDFDYMSKLTGRSVEELRAALAERIFHEPTGAWVAREEYLSGNVRKKLADAQAAALVDPEFKRNVEALQAVQPEDVLPSGIAAQAGEPWLPPDVVVRFMDEVLHCRNSEVSYAPILGKWSFVPRGIHGATNIEVWGTPDYRGDELLALTFNGQDPQVWNRSDHDHPVLDQKATAAAQEKAQKLRERFQEWLWEDDDRTRRLVRIYNDTYNAIRPRGNYDGSYLTLPGLVSPDIYPLRHHIKDAVARITQNGNTLLAHTMGAGKTATMICSAMEMRRLGIAQKPMIVVPNSVLSQWQNEFLRMYPLAKVLVATKDDVTPAKRKLLMAKIATGDWDAVVISHTSFGKIPVSPERLSRFYQEQIDDLVEAIANLKASEGKAGARLVKQLEKKRLTLADKMLTLQTTKKDNAVYFEQLGVDALFVDEAQAFKNLPVITSMGRVAGVPTAESQRSTDMFVKSQYINKITNNRGLIFATGTPITNTMAEVYNMQRYLQYDALREQNITHFDAWAKVFGTKVLAWQQTASGTYAPMKRFAKFIKLPELMNTLYTTMDVKTRADLGLKVPQLLNGKPTVVVCPASDMHKALMRDLRARSARIHSSDVDPKEDNMLKVTTDGRKIATDLRLYDPTMPDYPESKLNRCVDEVFKRWEREKERKGTQLIFLDHGVPGGSDTGVNLYEDIRQKLIRLGIPKKEIAFIHEASQDDAKLALFKAVDTGKVRVLIGSIEKMGVGVNAQSLMFAEHFLEPPWRPDQVEQAEARMVRQGNTYDPVEILHYVTQDTFDTYSWNLITAKARPIAQIMSGKVSAREMEDVDSRPLTYAEVEALTTGNKIIKQKIENDALVGRLNLLRAAHVDAVYAAKNRIAQLHEEIAALGKQLEDAKAIQETVSHFPEEKGKFRMEVLGRTYTDREEAGKAVREALHAFEAKGLTGLQKVGSYRGLPVYVVPGEGKFPAGLNFLGYGGVMPPTDVGITQSLGWSIARNEGFIKEYPNKVAEANKDIATLTSEAEKPFDKEAELAKALAEKADIEQKLALQENDPQSSLPDGPEDHPDGPPDFLNSGISPFEVLHSFRVGYEVVKRHFPDFTDAMDRFSHVIQPMDDMARSHPVLKPIIDAWDEGEALRQQLNHELFAKVKPYLDLSPKDQKAVDAVMAKLEAQAHVVITDEWLRNNTQLTPVQRQAVLAVRSTLDATARMVLQHFLDKFYSAFTEDWKLDPVTTDFLMQSLRDVAHTPDGALNIEDIFHALNKNVPGMVKSVDHYFYNKAGAKVVDTKKHATQYLSQAQRVPRQYAFIHRGRTGEDPTKDVWIVTTTSSKIFGVAQSFVRCMEAWDRTIPNYLPHRRYGRHMIVITPRGKPNETVWFSSYRTYGEMAAAAKKLAVEYPEEQFDMRTGIRAMQMRENLTDESPIGIGSLLERANLPPGLMEYLRREYYDLIRSKGFGSTFIHRKGGDLGIAGYEKDFREPIVAHLAGLAGWLGKIVKVDGYARGMERINPITNPLIYNAAKNYVEYTIANDKEFNATRNFLFHMYLGGNIKSAMVNATQNFTCGWPVLGKYTKWPLPKILTAMKDWVGYATKQKSLSPEETDALVWASKTGVLDEAFGREMAAVSGNPLYRTTFLHQLQAIYQGSNQWEVRRNAGALVSRVANAISMTPFGLAEQMNRSSLFLAAYRVFRGRGATIEDAQKLATAAVQEAHFQYGKGNKPAITRRIGAIPFTFMQWTFNYGVLVKNFLKELFPLEDPRLTAYKKETGAGEDAEYPGADEEQWAEQGPVAGMKGLGRMLLPAFLLGGLAATGTAGIVRAIYRHIWGKDPEEVLKQKAGPYVSRTVFRGVPAAFGADVSGPITPNVPNFPTDWSDRGKIAEGVLQLLFGPLTGMVMDRPPKLIRAIGAGDTEKAVEAIAPEAIRNAVAAHRLLTEGQTTAGGAPVMELNDGQPIQVKLNLSEAICKALGFQPTRLNELSQHRMTLIALAAHRADVLEGLADRYARAKTDAARAGALADLSGYNKMMVEAGRNAEIISAAEFRAAIRSRLMPSYPSGLRREVMYQQSLEGGTP